MTMSDALPNDLDSLPLSAEIRVDDVCRRFEAASKSEMPPRLEEFLGGADGVERLVLLRELVRLDVCYRRARQESPTAQEYFARFPELDATEIPELDTASSSATEAWSGAGRASLSTGEGANSTQPGDGSQQSPGTDRPALPDLDGYEVLSELGRGGMGVVFMARQTKLGRPVALKMILSGGRAGTAELARFRAEAEAIARLQHPNIVQIYEVGEQGGLPYFTLEFCGGGNLHRKLNGTPLPTREAAVLVETLARATEAAHRRNIIHRDLKPANILLAEDGTPKITDFGLAKKLDDDSGQTQSGAVVGTPSYMAPEQAGGKNKQLGSATDIYALGAILYECLTGRPPFKAATIMETLRQVASDEPVPPARLQSTVPHDLETICLKCLQKEPARRYESAGALADDLRRFLENRPIVARPVGGVERAVKWARRRPAIAGLLGVSVAAALAMVVFSVALLESNEQLKAANDELGAANTKLTIQTEEAQKAKKDAEGATQEVKTEKNLVVAKQKQIEEKSQEAIEKGAEVQRQAEQLRMFLFAGQVQKAVTEAETDPRRGQASLLDQRLCLPWLRDFAWGATYRRTRTYQALPVIAMQGSLDLSADGKRLAVWGSQDTAVRLLELPTGRDCTPKWRPLDDKDGLRSATLHRAIALSPDGKLLAMGLRRLQELFGGFGPGGFGGPRPRPEPQSPGQLDLWDTATGEKRATLVNKVGIENVAFSRDGKYLAATVFTPRGGGDIRVWDVATGRETLTIESQGVCSTIRFSPDAQHLFAETAGANPGGTERSLEFVSWNTSTGKREWTAKLPAGISSVAVSPDGGVIALQNIGRAGVWLLDAQNGTLLRTLEQPGNPAQATPEAFGNSYSKGFGPSTNPSASYGPTLSFTPDGKFLAGATPGGVALWDVSTGQARRQTGVIARCLAFLPDGRTLAMTTVRRDGTEAVGRETWLALWDVQYEPARVALAGLALNAVDPVGRRLVGTVPESNAQRLLNIEDGSLLAELPSTLTRSVFSSDGRSLAGTWTETVREVYDIGAAAPRYHTSSPVETNSLQTYAIPGGQLLLREERKSLKSGDNLLTYEVIDLGSGTSRARCSIKVERFSFSLGQFVRCSPDLKYLAIPFGGTKAVLRIWHLPSGKMIRELPGQTHVVFAPDGRAAVAYPMTNDFQPGTKADMKLFEVESGREPGSITGAVVQNNHTQGTSATFAFNRDGSLFAYLQDKGIVLWDVARGERCKVLEGHAAHVSALVVLAGSDLISVDDEGTWKRWDLKARKEKVTSNHAVGKVSRLAAARDGKRIATATAEGIQIWDADTGERIATIRDDGARLGDLEFVGDGQRLMSWGSRRMWDVRTGKEPGTYRNSPPRPFLSVSYTSDGKSLLAVSAPPAIRTPSLTKQWPEQMDETRSLLSRSIPPGATATVFDAGTGKERYRVPARSVPSVFTPDGRFVVNSLIPGENGDPVNEVFWYDPKQVVMELVVTEVATGKVAFRIPVPGDRGIQVWLPRDGNTLALAANGMAIQLWDLDTGKVRGTIPGKGVWNVRLSPDGKVLATINNQTELWDVATGKPWAPLREVLGFPIGFTLDGKVLATHINEPGNAGLGLWDLSAGRRIPWPAGPGPVIVRGVLVGDGRTLLRYPVKPQDPPTLWDLQRGQVSRECPGEFRWITDLPPSFSPDGRWLVLPGQSRAHPTDPAAGGYLVQTETGKLERELPGVPPVAFFAGGRTLVTGRPTTPTGGGTTSLIETATGRELQAFPGWLEIPAWSSRLVRQMEGRQPLTCPSPDGQTIMHAIGGVVRIYDSLTGELKCTFQGETERLPIQGVSADGKTLAFRMTEWRAGSSPGVLTYRTDLRVWDAETGDERKAPPGAFDTLDVEPSRRTLLGQRTISCLTLWDAATGKERLTLKGIVGGVKELAWSADGQSVATVSGVLDVNRPLANTGVTQIWDAASGRERCRFECEPGTAAFSPDGRHFAISAGNKVRIWVAETGHLRHTIDGAHRGVFAENGSTFVAVGETGLTVWDLDTGKVRRKVLTGEGIGKIQVTADGKGLLTQSRVNSVEQTNNRLTLWDLATGKERAGFLLPIPMTHDTALAWTPDGRTVAVIMPKSNTVSVFDMVTGQEQLVFPAPPAPKSKDRSTNAPPASVTTTPTLEFSDHGKRLLGHLHDGRVLVWDTQWPERPVAVALSGLWKAEGDVMVQELAAGGILLFGDPGWDEYDVEAEVSPDGSGLVGLEVRAGGPDRVEALLHSDPGGKSGLWEETGGAPKELQCRQEATGRTESLTPGQWYPLKVSVRGSLATMMIGNEALCEYRRIRARGQIGFVARGTSARFRNVRVTHAYGLPLWDGLPALPTPPPEVLAARHVQEGERLRAAVKVNEALEQFRLARLADPNNFHAAKQAGLILRELGRREEALDLLRQVPFDPQMKPMLDELRRGVIGEQFAEFVAGKRKARDEYEKVVLCSLCAERDYPLAGAQVYKELFTEYAWYRGAGGLSDHDPVPHRANAARAAALAGTGRGKDAVGLGEEQRKPWREQARKWLETELRLYTRLDGADVPRTIVIRQLLRGWQRDPAFAGVRDEAARLPADEREAWTRLWAEIDSWQQMMIALSYGSWRVDSQMLVEDATAGETVWLIGDPTWKDVTVEVEVQPRNGGGELGVIVRAQEADQTVRAVLGGWGRSAHGLIALSPGKGGENLAQPHLAAIELNRWYRVRIEARGTQLKLFVDGALLQDVREPRFASGRVGLFTLSHAARFRNFKVTDPDGKVLFEGVNAEAANPAVGTLMKQGREQFEAGKFAGAEKTFRAAVAQFPQDGDGPYWLAQTVQRQGRAAEAVGLFIQSLKHHPSDPAEVFSQLGLAQEAAGQFDLGVLAFRKALAIRQPFPQAAQNLRRVEKRRQTLQQLRDWESGQRQFHQPAGLLSLALSARDDCQRYVTSTRLFQTYLEKASQVRFGGPLPPLQRPFNGFTEYYEAACSAARAGTGQGDARELPEGERAKLRALALDWLRLELGRYQQAFKDRPTSVAGWLRAFTRHWEHDPDLEAVHAPEALKALPEKERAEWAKLWQELIELQKKADASPAGTWRIDGTELVQEDGGVPCIGLLTFGDSKWKDYDLELEAQITGGLGDIAILFRAADDHDFMAAHLGGWESRPGIWNMERVQRHAIAGFEHGELQRVVGPSLDGKLDPRRWYRVRLEVRGRKAALFLDGKKLLEADGLPRDQGKVGLRTAQATARFRHLKVVDPHGKLLFEGLPRVEP
jgi:WD40 repeat protein/tetratricopeptide (TPR) repeat protein